MSNEDKPISADVPSRTTHGRLGALLQRLLQPLLPWRTPPVDGVQVSLSPAAEDEAKTDPRQQDSTPSTDRAKPSQRGRPRRSTPAPRIRITLPDGHPLEPHLKGMSARQQSMSVLHWATLYKTQGQQVVPAPAARRELAESPRLLEADSAFYECLNLGVR